MNMNLFEVSYYDLYNTCGLTEAKVKFLKRKARKRKIKTSSNAVVANFLLDVFNTVFQTGMMPAITKQHTSDLAILVKAGRKIGKLAEMAKLELDYRYEYNKKFKKE